ncbi:MAG: lipopolysaccharide assembly protein LapA domain-containing protein [Desulfobaccales bacterium]
MSKIKVVLLIILAVVLVDFAFENSQPAPPIKVFKFLLGELPTFLLAYISLTVGLAIGWVAHGLRIRRKRREAQAAQAASAQQQQASQEGQAGRQAQ